MNVNGKFKGKTAQEILLLIQQKWPSYSDQVIRIDQVIEKAKDQIELLHNELKTEFAAMLNKNAISESDLDEQWRLYLQSEMTAQARQILDLIDQNRGQAEELLLSLRPSFLEIPQFIQSADIDSIIKMLPAMLESQMSQIDIVKQKINQAEQAEQKEQENSKISKLEALKHCLFSLQTLMISNRHPEETKIFTMASAIDAGQTNEHRNQIRQKVGTIENIEGFIGDLQFLSVGIRNDASLFEEPSSIETQYMLNWVGEKADCKRLIKFLLRNGYLEGTSVDQYIAKHFLFKGKKLSPKAINGNHSEYNGHIEIFSDHLQIPANKK